MELLSFRRRWPASRSVDSRSPWRPAALGSLASPRRLRRARSARPQPVDQPGLFCRAPFGRPSACGKLAPRCRAPPGRAPFDGLRPASCASSRTGFHFGLPDRRSSPRWASSCSRPRPPWPERAGIIRGCDGIIARNLRAGGHRGSFSIADRAVHGRRAHRHDAGGGRARPAGSTLRRRRLATSLAAIGIHRQHGAMPRRRPRSTATTADAILNVFLRTSSCCEVSVIRQSHARVYA